MLRLAPVAALLLLAGCAGPGAPLQEAGAAQASAADAPEDGGWVVTATRVEPLVHRVNWTGQMGARACAPDGSEPCRGPAVIQSGVAAGISWDEPDMAFRDEKALFWRLDLAVAWASKNPLVPGLELEVRSLPSCEECRERVLGVFRGESPIVIERHDIFLQPDEVGLTLQLRPVEGSVMESAWGAAAVQYNVLGGVSGFRPAADPIVLSP